MHRLIMFMLCQTLAWGAALAQDLDDPNGYLYRPAPLPYLASPARQSWQSNPMQTNVHILVQHGLNNAAVASQSGARNVIVLQQIGTGNSASIRQR